MIPALRGRRGARLGNAQEGKAMSGKGSSIRITSDAAKYAAGLARIRRNERRKARRAALNMRKATCK